MKHKKKNVSPHFFWKRRTSQKERWNAPSRLGLHFFTREDLWTMTTPSEEQQPLWHSMHFVGVMDDACRKREATTQSEAARRAKGLPRWSRAERGFQVDGWLAHFLTNLIRDWNVPNSSFKAFADSWHLIYFCFSTWSRKNIYYVTIAALLLCVRTFTQECFRGCDLLGTSIFIRCFFTSYWFHRMLRLRRCFADTDEQAWWTEKRRAATTDGAGGPDA